MNHEGSADGETRQGARERAPGGGPDRGGGAAGAGALLTRLLADRRACNRRFARFALGQLDPAFDVPAWYRRALSTTRDPLVLGAIIQGYGECDVTDPGPLVPYTTHANNRVKAAANIATTMIERQRATATGGSSGSS